MATRRFVLGGLGSAFMVGPAFAHRSMRTETEIRIKSDGTVDVTHVYHAQDAQDALYAMGIINRPDITSLNARARMALYTAERFSIRSDNVPCSLSIIGAELVGSDIYVYQTGSLQDPDGALIIEASMLREHVSGQVNSVNIIRNGQTVTVNFTGDEGPKPVA